MTKEIKTEFNADFQLAFYQSPIVHFEHQLCYKLKEIIGGLFLSIAPHYKMGFGYSASKATNLSPNEKRHFWQKVKKEVDLPTCDESPVERRKKERKRKNGSVQSKAKCHSSAPAHQQMLTTKLDIINKET